MDQELDPVVVKLLEYAKDKQIISWDEINEILGQDFVNSPKMENVLQLLTQNNIQVMEEDNLDEDEDDDESLDEDGEGEESDDEAHIVNGDKDSSVDDPIRLYLREIGKEKLLTAEEEVKYSKEMEDGENIIKGVIKDSGMMIPEFLSLPRRLLPGLIRMSREKQEKKSTKKWRKNVA